MKKPTFTEYVLEKKQRHNITPTLKWYTIKSVPSSNITKSCMLCIDKKFEILTYPNLDELLNLNYQNLFLHVVILISIYCPTMKLMTDIPFNTFCIIA